MPQDFWSLSGGTYWPRYRPSLPARFLCRSKLRKNKKPGVERRAQPLSFQWLRAKLDKIYPVLVRYLTLGSDYCPADPTVNPLIGPADLAIPRTICNYTESPGDVKPLQQLFLKNFPQGCGNEKSPIFPQL
jgi:hypothetical protein